jgi:hypothetical protein
MPSNYF